MILGKKPQLTLGQRSIFDKNAPGPDYARGNTLKVCFQVKFIQIDILFLKKDVSCWLWSIIMKVSVYNSAHTKDLAYLFHAAVHAISSDLYSKEQREAWAPTPPNIPFWEKRFQRTRPFVALNRGSSVGFIELVDNGYIDCLYVHPIYQRLGVASALYKHVEDKAKTALMTHLTVDASKAAEGFFIKRGFEYVRTNTFQRHGVILTNAHMIKAF